MISNKPIILNEDLFKKSEIESYVKRLNQALGANSALNFGYEFISNHPNPYKGFVIVGRFDFPNSFRYLAKPAKEAVLDEIFLNFSIYRNFAMSEVNVKDGKAFCLIHVELDGAASFTEMIKAIGEFRDVEIKDLKKLALAPFDQLLQDVTKNKHVLSDYTNLLNSIISRIEGTVVTSKTQQNSILLRELKKQFNQTSRTDNEEVKFREIAKTTHFCRGFYPA